MFFESLKKFTTLKLPLPDEVLNFPFFMGEDTLENITHFMNNKKYPFELALFYSQSHKELILISRKWTDTHSFKGGIFIPKTALFDVYFIDTPNKIVKKYTIIKINAQSSKLILTTSDFYRLILTGIKNVRGLKKEPTLDDLRVLMPMRLQGQAQTGPELP